MPFEMPGNLAPAESVPDALKARVEQSVEAFKQALGPMAMFASREQLDQYRAEVTQVALFSYAAGYRAAAKRGVRG